MPEIPEKYKTLREITEAIAKADDEIIENHQVSTLRAKRYGRAVLAREEFADAKSLVAEKTEKATADFLREAAHHDVKHAIHKAEHRLAEARCQAVFKQRPFLQHLDKAREAAATQGHAKRSQHTVEAGPWRAAVVAQLDSFEDSVRKPAHEGGLAFMLLCACWGRRLGSLGQVGGRCCGDTIMIGGGLHLHHGVSAALARPPGAPHSAQCGRVGAGERRASFEPYGLVVRCA